MRARLFLLALLAIFGLLHSTSGEEDEFGLMESGEVEATEPGIKEFDASKIEARRNPQTLPPYPPPDPRPNPPPPPYTPKPPRRIRRPWRFNKGIFPPWNPRPDGISGRYIVDIRPYRGVGPK